MRKKSPSTGGGGSSGSRLRSFMPSSSSYVAAEGVALAAIVTYDVMLVRQSDGGKTKMPRPGPIVATFGFYGLLAALGSISRSFEPVVVAVGWVLALSILVTGRRGAGIVGLIQKLADSVGTLGGDGNARYAH